MTKKPGKFITVEGCEGVGKSTQIALLKEYCAAQKIDAVFTREPGGTPIAERVRSVILDPNCVGMDALTELFLYAAARRQHTQEFILPSLQAGKTVFCDRYTDSTLAYQGYGRGIDKDIIRTLNTWALAEVQISRTLFIDVNPRDGFLRKGGRDLSDRLENESIEFHERVYEGFCAIAAEEPNRVLRLDGSGTAQQVFSRILSALNAEKS